MSNPLQNRGGEQRAGDEEKILRALDILAAIIRALFRITGRRREDRQ